MMQGITDAEKALVNSAADLWNRFLELPVEHPMDREEFCRAIHTVQGMILMRSGRRLFNAKPST